MIKQMVIIDVRTPAEFAEGHVEGAKLLPLDQIGEGIAGIVPDKDTPVGVYCRSGRRSGAAKEILEEMGYRNVQNLGGLNDAAQMLKAKD